MKWAIAITHNTKKHICPHKVVYAHQDPSFGYTLYTNTALSPSSPPLPPSSSLSRLINHHFYLSQICPVINSSLLFTIKMEGIEVQTFSTLMPIRYYQAPNVPKGNHGGQSLHCISKPMAEGGGCSKWKWV